MEQDFSLPGAIRLVEQFRASGDLFGSFAHRVALDFCLEHGVMLRVTSNRTVPIKKSNPGVRYQHQKADAKPLASRHRYVDKGKLQRAQPGARPRLAGLAGFPLQQAERPIGESYQFPVDMAMTPENGFTYAGNHREAFRGENAALFGIDAESAELWAATPAAPAVRVGAADLTFDDHGRHLEQHRLMLASNPTRGASYGGIWYGQRFLEMPRWPWKSDAIFADILEEEARDLRDAWALREAMVEEMAEQGFITGADARNLMVTHVDQHRRTITIAPRPRPAIRIVENPFVREGEAFLLPDSRVDYAFITGRRSGKSEMVRQCARLLNVGLGEPPPRPKSRVPEFLQNTRLDGRRR